MSWPVILHVESEKADRLVEIRSPADQRLGVFVSDGPHLTCYGEKVLEAYEKGNDGDWRESAAALNELYTEVMKQGEYDVKKG